MGSGVLKISPGLTRKNLVLAFSSILLHKRNLSNFFGGAHFFSLRDTCISDNLGPTHATLNSSTPFAGCGCGLASCEGLPTGREYASQGGSIISIPMILIYKSALINSLFGNTELMKSCPGETDHSQWAVESGC